MKNVLLIVLVLITVSCIEKNPNQSSYRTAETQTLRKANINLNDSTLLRRKVYVPIYSDIYQKGKYETTLLTATLSIRNTSEFDSLYLSRVDYFNTKGDLVRKYLDQNIYLNPMETIDYVIDEKDTLGGSGANFILEWYGKKHLTPVIQAVMIGGLGNKSFSFTTEGSVIDE